MPNYARIEDGVAAEVIGYDPTNLYHPSLIWVACPDTVAQGWQYDGTGWTPPSVTPPSEPDPSGEAYAAAQVQAAKDVAIQAARDSCQAALVSLATRFSDLERQTWERQLAEATAILQDAEPTKAKYPVIGGIIEVTGETFSDFAMAVQANNEAWSAASAGIIGQRQKLVAQIKAATTVAEVAAVGTTITLPS